MLGTSIFSFSNYVFERFYFPWGVNNKQCLERCKTPCAPKISNYSPPPPCFLLHNMLLINLPQLLKLSFSKNGNPSKLQVVVWFSVSSINTCAKIVAKVADCCKSFSFCHKVFNKLVEQSGMIMLQKQYWRRTVRSDRSKCPIYFLFQKNFVGWTQLKDEGLQERSDFERFQSKEKCVLVIVDYWIPQRS